MHIVDIKSLTKTYGALTAVDSIDCQILQGECFGFLGPNGAGKTTVMRIIYCFMPPTSGEVTVFGLYVIDKPSLVKARIGVMPQEDNLDPDLNVFENLIVYARYFDIMKQEAVNRAWELIDFVDLREKARAKIEQLSGGVKRRLILARSLINNPALLILDEPTTGLDPHSRRAVWEKLNQLKANSTTLAARPRKLVIPPSLQFIATRLLESNLRVGTNDNDINALKNNGSIPEGYTINHFLTDTNAWFLTTDVPNGMKHFVRSPLSNSMDGDFDTGNVRYKSRERYSFGWSDPLGMYVP